MPIRYTPKVQAHETPASEMHIREMYTREIYAHRSVAFFEGYGGCCKGMPRTAVFTLASDDDVDSNLNSHHRQNAAVLLSRTYVFTAFGGRRSGVAFLILTLSGNLAGLYCSR